MSATPWKYDEGFGWIVDAGEGIVCQFWGKAEEPFHNSVENALLVERAVNAFDALLAVAKAAEPFIPFQTPEDAASCGCGGCVLRRSIAALDPDWRSWPP